MAKLAGFIVLTVVGLLFKPVFTTDVLPSLMGMSDGVYSSILGDMMTNKILDNVTQPAPLTMFLVPNNVYKAALNESSKELADPANLKKLLSRHVVADQKLMPRDIVNYLNATSLSGDILHFNVYGDKNMMTINGRTFTMEPQVLPNVVVYKMPSMVSPSMATGLIELLNMRLDKLSTLLQAIQLSGLGDTLSQGGPYTLFAPTNDAFKILTDDGTLTKLMASPSDLKRLLLGHVVAGSYFLPSLVNGLEIRALDGDINAIRVERMTGKISIDGANLVNDNMRFRMFTDKGSVLHMIDRVLM